MVTQFLSIAAAIGAIAHALVLPTNGANALARAANQILEHQVTDGAIVMGTNPQRRSRVIPYCANLAGLGLVAAFRDTGDTNYLTAARRWAAWYGSHTNLDGTIDDFEGVSGQWKATGHYDSSDSYAATFLELIQAINGAAPDKAWLDSIRPAAQCAVNAIHLTLQTNGLTWARPDWPVMYLMDNTEAARGLRAAAKLGFDTQAMALAMEQSVLRRLWNDQTQSYSVGLEKNVNQVKSPETWYPFVMANLMAIAWLPAQPRHEPLMRRFEAQFASLIPSEVRTEDDLDHLVWWAMAAQSAGDATLRTRLVTKLNAFDAEVKAFKNPNLLGHLCRILAGETF